MRDESSRKIDRNLSSTDKGESIEGNRYQRKTPKPSPTVNSNGNNSSDMQKKCAIPYSLLSLAPPSGPRLVIDISW